jgi:hypothetical protein
MHRFVSSFEIVTEAFASHRGIDVSHLPDLADLAETEAYPPNDIEDSAAVVSLTQRMLAQFLAEGWHVFCIPPGIDYRNLPFGQVISRAHGSAESDIGGHWLVVILDQEGRRAGSQRLKTVPAMATPFLRNCAVIKCLLTHGVGMPDGQKAESLQGLKKTEDALADGNPAQLRQLLRAIPITEGDGWGQSFFGAMWDIVHELSHETADPVAAGTWRFPDPPQRALRTRAAILKDAARAFLVPATFRADILRLHVLEWLTLSSPPNPQVVLGLIDTVTIAHSLWLSALVPRVGAELHRSGVIHGTAAVTNIQRALLGQLDVHLPGALVARASSFLTRDGHADWADRLNVSVQPVLQNHVPDHLLARRLRGLRIIGGMTLREAASTVGISSSRASYLVHKKYRLDQVNREWLERDAARILESHNGGSASQMTEFLQSGTLDESVFDAFESLQPTRTTTAADQGHDD